MASPVADDDASQATVPKPQSSTAPTKSSGKIPADKVNLKLILVSGKTHEFHFTHSDTASTISQHVYDNWPQGWAEEVKPATNILRLIYQGRFLHGNVSLGALQLPTGKTTVMHLVARENLPEPNHHGQQKKDKGGARPSANGSATERRQAQGCCQGCTIS